MTTKTKKRFAYFVSPGQVDENGEFVPCIAYEGEKGFRRMDGDQDVAGWRWGKDLAIAQECADDKNRALGLESLDALKIISSSM